MPRTLSASEAKTRFGALLDWATEHQEEVIVANHGEPKAVIVPFAIYQQLLACRAVAQRHEALAALEALRERLQARPESLSEEQAEALAERFSSEVVTEMIGDGRVAYRR